MISRASERRRVSIICPVRNEEESVPVFYQRLRAALLPLADRYDFEVLFTNNRSTDRTLDIIATLHQQDPAVQVITLSRNFGYQASVMAGLAHARGEAMVVIDVDCEDPPEMLPRFIAEWEKGYDVVYGRREKRLEFIGIHWMRKVFYRLLRLTADSEIILDMAEFALVSATVRDQMLNNDSTFPFLRTEIGYVGFERKGIPYTRQQRIRGRSHYNFFGMALFAMGGFLSSSTFLLRAAALAGGLLAPATLLSLLLAVWMDTASASRILLVLDLSYLVFFASITSAYLARIYKNGVRRPVFVVDWKRTIYNDEAQPSAARAVQPGAGR